jgi:PAS domain S-box-containing protein
MDIDAGLAKNIAAAGEPTDEQFRLLVGSLSDYAICLLDADGRVASWNAGAERTFGYRAGDVLGQDLAVFYAAEERAAGRPRTALERAQREGRSRDHGWQRRADGSRFWADVTLSALREPGGELRGFAVVTQDTTALRSSREAEQLLAAMFDRAPGGIVMVDTSGRYARANPAFLRLVGYSEEELRGKTLNELAHPDDVEATWEVFNDLVQGRRSQVEYEKRYLRKSGRAIWVRNTVARLPDADGRLKFLIGMVEDITERRRADERIRELLERQRSLTGLSLAALAESGLSGVLHRAVELVRERLGTEFVRLLELTADEQQLKLVAACGWKPGLVFPVLPGSPAGYALYSPQLAGKPRRPLVVEDLPRDERVGRGGMLLEAGAVSGMSVVIPGAQAPYGVLDAYTAARRRFDEADTEFLSALVNVISVAVQREQAHQRLATSEALLQAFTQHSPAVMSLKDREGRYRFVNEQFLRRFGLRREEVVGRRDDEIFPAAQAAAFAANDARVLSAGAALTFEETARYIDGERFNVVVKFPVLDGAGAIIGVGGVATDITERRRVEQALLEQRTLLSEAQKLAGLGCWEWDPASGRVIWSEELYRIYGVSAQDFRPSFENYLERVHPDDRSRTAGTVAAAVTQGRGFTFEERIVRPDGEVRLLRSHGEVVRGGDGKAAKVLGACLDITEQKAAESALRALSRRLVEAEEAERRRIARELHDSVGQNLSALNINLDLLSSQLPHPPAGVARRLADSQSLVDATLQSIESVMADLRPPLLDEYGLEAALRWYGDEFARRMGVPLAVEAAPALGALRPEAAVALFRIAQEALNNTAKHAAAASIKVTLGVDNGEVMLSIADDGRGFDPASVRRGRWGMSTMRERAEAAGGRLAVESAPGQGTTVRASVPL